MDKCSFRALKQHNIKQLSLTILLLSAFLAPQSSFAVSEGFYWKIGNSYGDYHTASLAMIQRNWGSQKEILQAVKNMYGQPQPVCTVYTTSFVCKPPYFGRTDGSRFGSSCRPGMIYNNADGGCDFASSEAGNACADQAGASSESPNLIRADGTCATFYKSLGQQGNPPTQSCPSQAEETTPLFGNPINFSAGNKFQVEQDYQSSGAAPLTLSRAYNSIDGVWRHSLSTNLRVGSALVILTTADGRESYFSLLNGIATSRSNDLGSLTQANGTWTYIATNNQRFDFDSVGNLKQVIYSSGVSQKLTTAYYSTYNQITVLDSLGQSLVLKEDALHQPLSMTAAGISITYTYDTSKRLTKVSRTIAGQTTNRTFTYAGTSKLLTGITDERGMPYAFWTYDALDRAITSEHAGGAEKVSISYNGDGSTTVTNPLGKSTIYQFQFIQGTKRITAINGEPSAGCPMSNSTFTYDDRGLLKTKTDNKGFVTTYDYNERGLEVIRTEAAGTPQARTTTTTWHATLNLPLTVTEPGRVTTYTYDSQGRQLSQTSTAL